MHPSSKKAMIMSMFMIYLIWEVPGQIYYLGDNDLKTKRELQVINNIFSHR